MNGIAIAVALASALITVGCGSDSSESPVDDGNSPLGNAASCPVVRPADGGACKDGAPCFYGMPNCVERLECVSGVWTETKDGDDCVALACATDADCRTFSSSCRYCTCGVTGATMPDPQCPAADRVQCDNDSCEKVVPTCGADKRCVMTEKP